MQFISFKAPGHMITEELKCYTNVVTVVASNKALEECCKQAIALNKQKYTFIKNTISVVADDLGEAGYRHSTPAK
ncbi:hypothetical protein, partial [Jutongia sp.]